MELRRIQFEYMDDKVQIDFLPADPRYNSIFAAALEGHVRPFSLAARVGRLSEDVARQNLARAYAEGVVCGSPTPGYENYKVRDWARWLDEHPEEFEQLRLHAEPREMDGELGAAGDTH